jgi:hypothetical protein
VRFVDDGDSVIADGPSIIKRLLVMGLTVRVGDGTATITVASSPAQGGGVGTNRASVAVSRSAAEAPLTRSVASETYGGGELVTVHAAPRPGWHFIRWLMGGVPVSTDADYQFVAENAALLTAQFEQGAGRTLSVSASDGGTVARFPDAGSYTPGSKVTLVATADPGYKFAGWSGGISGYQNPFILKVWRNMSVTATFVSTPCTIQLAASPAGGGTVSGGGTFQPGDADTVVATPASGYYFVNWTQNGQVVSTDASYTFDAAVDRNLVANFAAGQGAAITVADTDGGEVELEPPQAAYAPSTQVEVFANAATGYTFESWSGDIHGTDNPVVVTTGSTDILMAPHFAPVAAKPDLLVGVSPQAMLGDNVYGSTYTAGQSASVVVKRGGRKTVFVYLENDGAATATFSMGVSDYFGRQWQMKINGVPGTRFGQQSCSLAPGEGRMFAITVSASPSLRKGSHGYCGIQAWSDADGSQSDIVLINATAR